MVIALAATLVAGATTAYFSDVERSFGNTFTAGSLDLKIDGKDCNVVKFVHFNMKPGDVVKVFINCRMTVPSPDTSIFPRLTLKTSKTA